jgi:hypothetical protein
LESAGTGRVYVYPGPMVVKLKETGQRTYPDEALVVCFFFHENNQFYARFQKPGTRCSGFCFFFSIFWDQKFGKKSFKMRKISQIYTLKQFFPKFPQFFCSLIIKILKTWNQGF